MQTAPTSCHQEYRTQDPEFSPVEGLLVERIGDEVLVLNPGSGRIHQFNHTAGIVWRGITDGLTREMITRNIMTRYEVPEFRAAKDTDTMIEQLRILKLLKPNSEGGSPDSVREYRQNKK